MTCNSIFFEMSHMYQVCNLYVHERCARARPLLHSCVFTVWRLATRRAETHECCVCLCGFTCRCSWKRMGKICAILPAPTHWEEERRKKRRRRRRRRWRLVFVFCSSELCVPLDADIPRTIVNLCLQPVRFTPGNFSERCRTPPREKVDPRALIRAEWGRNSCPAALML